MVIAAGDQGGAAERAWLAEREAELNVADCLLAFMVMAALLPARVPARGAARLGSSRPKVNILGRTRSTAPSMITEALCAIEEGWDPQCRRFSRPLAGDPISPTFGKSRGLVSPCPN
jgi:hypothetical protein